MGIKWVGGVGGDRGGPLDLGRSERRFYSFVVVKRCFRSQTVCEDWELVRLQNSEAGCPWVFAIV